MKEQSTRDIKKVSLNGSLNVYAEQDYTSKGRNEKLKSLLDSIDKKIASERGNSKFKTLY